MTKEEQEALRIKVKESMRSKNPEDAEALALVLDALGLTSTAGFVRRNAEIWKKGAS